MPNPFIILMLLFPVISFAAPGNVMEFVSLIIDLIRTTIPVLMGLALLIFFWGLVKFIINSGDATSHKDGRQFMMWGLIALFAMLSVYGIITYAKDQLEFQGGTIIPVLPTQ